MLIGNPMIFRQMPLEQALSRVADAGFDALELWPPQIEESCTVKLRQLLSEHIRALGMVPLRLNCADRNYFQAINSRYDLPVALDGLRADIDIAADLGMTQLLTWEGRRSPSFTETDISDWVLDATVELFQKACAYGRERGISLTIEVHPFTLGIDLDWLINLCDLVDAPDFSVTYDCCHFAVGMPENYVSAIHRLGHRIGHVHFSDSDKRSSEVHFAPGTGCLDLDAVVQALKDITFDGTMMLDLWLYPLPDQGTKLGTTYVREVIQRLGIAK